MSIMNDDSTNSARPAKPRKPWPSFPLYAQSAEDTYEGAETGCLAGFGPEAMVPLARLLGGLHRLVEPAAVIHELPHFVVAALLAAVVGDLGHVAQAERIGRLGHAQRTSDMLLILNVLCLDGFIPAGRYMVDTKLRRPAIEVYQALLEKHRDPQARECVQFRERHRGNPGFVKRAAVLDNAVSDWLRKQQ